MALVAQLIVVMFLALPLAGQTWRGWSLWALLVGPGLVAWFLTVAARRRAPALRGYLRLSKEQRRRRAAPLFLAGLGGLLTVLAVKVITGSVFHWPWWLVPALPAVAGALIYFRRRVPLELDDHARGADQ